MKSQDETVSLLHVKVPSLRNVDLTGPYFHDGSQATLTNAVRKMTKYRLGRRLTDREVERSLDAARTSACATFLISVAELLHRGFDGVQRGAEFVEGLGGSCQRTAFAMLFHQGSEIAHGGATYVGGGAFNGMSR